MNTLIAILPWLIGLSLIVVAGSLFTGLVSMTRGGDFNARYGNILMRWRIGSQAVTVVLFLAYALLTRLG